MSSIIKFEKVIKLDALTIFLHIRLLRLQLVTAMTVCFFLASYQRIFSLSKLSKEHVICLNF